jgi:hypothetical protein
VASRFSTTNSTRCAFPPPCPHLSNPFQGITENQEIIDFIRVRLSLLAILYSDSITGSQCCRSSSR